MEYKEQVIKEREIELKEMEMILAVSKELYSNKMMITEKYEALLNGILKNLGVKF